MTFLQHWNILKVVLKNWHPERSFSRKQTIAIYAINYGEKKHLNYKFWTFSVVFVNQKSHKSVQRDWYNIVLNYRSHLYQLVFAEWKALHMEYSVSSQLSTSRNTSFHARHRQERQCCQLCRDRADCWVIRWQELVCSGIF